MGAGSTASPSPIGIGVALRRSRLSGCELEGLLGHCTYLALVKRPLLSCFHASCRYVQSTYWSKNALWSTVVGRAHTLQSSDDLLLLALVGALVHRGVLHRCFSLRIRPGGGRLDSR